jgi:hypothetical protein
VSQTNKRENNYVQQKELHTRACLASHQSSSRASVRVCFAERDEEEKEEEYGV